MVSHPILELQNINKSFGHVQANKDISLKVSKGDIHGIIGENGAGKSTLMSIVYGFYQADSGNIKLNDKEYLEVYCNGSIAIVNDFKKLTISSTMSPGLKIDKNNYIK